MPLDTRIALSGQPIQLENPLAQYGQFMGAIHAGTQNQLAMQQVSAIQRAAEEEAGAKGYLSGGVDLSTPEGQRGLLAFGKTGLAYQKALAEQNKAKLESDKTAAEVLGLSHKNFNTANSPLAASANGIPGITAYVEALYQDPLLGPMAAKIKPKDQALKENLALYAESPEKWTLAHANLDGQHLLEALKTAEARRVEANAAKLIPGYVDPNAPKPAVAALPEATATTPINNMRAAFAPVPDERSVNALQLGDGNVVYRVDGKDVPFAVYADAVRGRNQAQGANAALATTPDMTSAAMAPAAATAPAAAVAAGQPDVLNALKVKIQGLETYRNQLLPDIGKSAAVKAQWEDLGKQIDNLSKGFSVSPDSMHVLPGVGVLERAPTSAEITTMKALGFPITPDGFKAFSESKRQERLLTPDEEAQRLRLAKAGATNVQTNVNAYTPASEEAQRDFIKSTRATYDTLKNAPATLKNIDEAIKLIPNAKGFMGPGGESLLDAASFLNSRLGTSINTKGISDATELRSRLFQGIIENLRKLDANPTENQQNAMRVALGNIGTDPNALPAVLNSFADTVRSKVEAHNAEVNGAVARGVKFPYDPTIKLPTFTPLAPSGAALIPTGKSAAGAGGWKVIK